jgi:hypothetical protein
MKLSEILNEGRLDTIAKMYGDKLVQAAHNDVSARGVIRSFEPIQIVNALAGLDPTPDKKTVQFLAIRYSRGEFRFEDKTRVVDALTQFYKIQQTLANRDINQYRTLHDLYAAVEETTDTVIPVSGKEEKRRVKEEGSKVVVKGDGITIVHLLTGEAAKYYAAGTKWCTSAESTFEDYAKSGDIYVIMVKQPNGVTRKFQFHYQSGQVMNEKDHELVKNEIALLSGHSEWYQFVEMMVRKHHFEHSNETA